MKVWVMIFTLAIFAGGTCLGVAVDRNYLAKAEAAPAPPERPWGGGGPWEMSVHHFVRELGLTEDQDRELDRILGETQRDIEAYYRAIRATHERSRDKVTAILSEEQKKRLDELRNAERARKDEEEVQRSVRKYAAALSLDEAQRDKVGDVFRRGKEEKRAYFASHKGGDGSVRAFFRGLRDKQRSELKGVLTEDQFKRYSEMEE